MHFIENAELNVEVRLINCLKEITGKQNWEVIEYKNTGYTTNALVKNSEEVLKLMPLIEFI